MSDYSNSSRDIEISDIDTDIDLEINWRKIRTSANSPDRLYAGADDDISQASMSSVEIDEDEQPWETETVPPQKKKKRKYLKWLKICVLFCIWLVFTGLLLVEHVKEDSDIHYVCVPRKGEEKVFIVPESAQTASFFVRISGPFEELTLPKAVRRNARVVKIKLQHVTENSTHDVSEVWTAFLGNTTNYDSSRLVPRTHLFHLHDRDHPGVKILQMNIITNFDYPVSLEITYNSSPIDPKTGIVISLLLICGLYTLLILDVVHRALAIVLFCTLAIAMLALLNVRPSLRAIIGWINFEVLLLLFGFTLVIAVLAETGVIDYMAMRIYEISNGHIWPMLNTLCLITFLGSSFFDNVLLILIIAPITMRLCEVMELNPVPLLTCLMISSNVGATLTPNGETPNDYVTQNEFLRLEGVNELVFLEHIFPGSLFAAATAYLYMRVQYHNSNSMRFRDGAEVERLRRVIKVWSRTAKSISAYSRDEKAMRETVYSKVRRLRRRLKRLGKMPMPAANYSETLKTMKKEFRITDQVLLIKCTIALIFAGILIVLHLFPDVHYLSTAWVALLACLLLLILADSEDFDGILARIEWSSMLFLAGFLVFTEATTQLGMFEVIGEWTHKVIAGTNSNARLGVAILSMLWISAICASFLADNAVGSMMLRVVLMTVKETHDELPIQPLLWAVILGTSLGGTGTLVGTYSSVICAGLAEKHGYNFPFVYYCKVGFPIMLLCVLSSTGYLMVAHTVMHWH